MPQSGWLKQQMDFLIVQEAERPRSWTTGKKPRDIQLVKNPPAIWETWVQSLV